jgi:hypothetical protein
VQPATPPPARTGWQFAAPIIAVVIMALAVLFYFQTRDPAVIIFGFIGAVLISSLLRPWRWYGYGHPGWGPGWWGPAQPPQQIVKIKCASCGALNDEHARFCSQCGKPT